MRKLDAWWPEYTAVPDTTSVPDTTTVDSEEGAEKMLELFFGPAIITIACSIDMSGTGEMVAKNTRVIRNASLMSAEGYMNAHARRYKVEQLEFTGDFEPGDTIEIDSKNLKFTLNGKVKNRLMVGDFIELGKGVSGIKFEDNETNRTVLVRVSYREKYF